VKAALPHHINDDGIDSCEDEIEVFDGLPEEWKKDNVSDRNGNGAPNTTAVSSSEPVSGAMADGGISCETLPSSSSVK
jgi:hypothetical protein